MSLSARDHERVRSAFVRSLDLPRSRRPGFVRQALADRPDLADVAIDMLVEADDPTFDSVTEQSSATWDEPLLAQERLGDYRILGLVGRGGMAVVLHAEHVVDAREVALKLLPLGTGSRALRDRLTRESDVLRQLKHPNIARWRAGGELDAPEGPRPFVAMDYFHGESLLEWVRNAQPDTSRRLAVLEQVARAVAHAHEHGIIHRDLKPSNVLVGPRDHVCVLDFGVAKVLSEARADGGTLTEVGQLVGTIRFMSPEQASGRLEKIGPGTDVHAIGLMIQEVMTGEPPYPVPTNVAEALPVIVHARRKPPQVDDPKLRVALRRICDGSLARDPDVRLQEAAVLADDLAAAREGRSVPRRRSRWRRMVRRWGRPARIAAVAVLIAVLAAIVVRDRASGPAPGPTMEDVRNILVDTRRMVDEGPAEAAVLQSALDGLTTARGVVRSIDDRTDLDVWRRLLEWREGQLRFLQGGLERNVTAYEAARRCFERALAFSVATDQLTVQGPDSLVMAEVASLRPSEIMRHVARAHARLADFREPATEVERAAMWHTQSLSELARERLGPAADWRDLQPRFGDAEQGWPRQEIAADFVRLAALQGRASDAEEAIAHLRQVEDFAMLRTDPAANASARYVRARAHLMTAVLDTTPEPLDQAEHWLRRSLEDRPLDLRPRAHVQSQIGLVHVDRLRTRFATTQDSAALWLDSALARAETLVDTASVRLGALERGRVATAAAGAAVEAMLRGVQSARPVAVEWLERATAGLPADEARIDGAWLELDRARFERACLLSCGESLSGHLERALASLGVAAGTFPRGEYQRLHAAIDRERASWATVVGLVARD